MCGDVARGLQGLSLMLLSLSVRIGGLRPPFPNRTNRADQS
jgi:hypothetical protein